MIKRKNPSICEYPKPIETTKVAEISDIFGNLRYKIVLTNYNIGENYLDSQLNNYEIEVINCFSGDEPFVIIHKPSLGETKIYNYKEALTIYEGYKKHYTDLIHAETKDIQDINLYKDKIDYKIVDVKCCAQCVYCKVNTNPKDHIIGQTGKAVCTNPNLIKIDHLDFCDTHHLDKHNFHHSRPDVHSHLSLYPRVDLDGLCKNFKKSHKQIHEVDGMSLIDLVYGKLNNKFDKFMNNLSGIVNDSAITELSGQINNVISASFEEHKSQLLNDVGYEIDKKLQEGIIIDGDDATEEYDD